MEYKEPEPFNAEYMEKKVPYNEQMARLSKLLETTPKSVLTKWEKIKSILKKSQ